MIYERRDGSTDLSDRVSKLYSVISTAYNAKKSFDELNNYFVNRFRDEIIINLPAVQYIPEEIEKIIEKRIVEYTSEELEKIEFPYNRENPYYPDEKKLTRGHLISFGFKESDDVYYWCCVNMFEEVHASFTRVWVDTFFINTNYRFWWYSEIATERTLYDPAMDDVSVDFDVSEFGSTGGPREDPCFQIEDRPSQRVIHNGGYYTDNEKK